MEYDHYFTKLVQFSLYIVFNEHQRAHHFERRICLLIKNSIITLILLIYAKVFNQALMVKKLDNELQ